MPSVCVVSSMNGRTAEAASASIVWVLLMKYLSKFDSYSCTSMFCSLFSIMCIFWKSRSEMGCSNALYIVTIMFTDGREGTKKKCGRSEFVINSHTARYIHM